VQSVADELGRAAGVKEELIGELTRVQARQRDAVTQTEAVEDQLKRAETMVKQLEQRRTQLAFSEKKITTFEQRLTDLTRATARRFLLTLVELGYVRTDGSQFWLTPRVLELGYSYLSSLTLPDVAGPHLESLAEQVREARSIKPLWAIVDGMACSAAYALACGAGRVTCSSVGYTGSVGVIAAHWDYSRMLDEAGVKVSLIYAGSHKADGNAFEPLPESVRDDFQAEIDAIYAQFVPLVAAGRGLEEKAVRNTEARAYLAAPAVDLGLCDAVMSPTDALLELVDLASR